MDLSPSGRRPLKGVPLTLPTTPFRPTSGTSQEQRLLVQMTTLEERPFSAWAKLGASVMSNK